MAAALRKRLGGRPRLDRPKQAINIRLDQDVIDKFKATSPGWQTRIHEALKAAKVGVVGPRHRRSACSHPQAAAKLRCLANDEFAFWTRCRHSVARNRWSGIAEL